MWKFWIHPADRKLAENVKQYGWHCLHVSPRLGEPGPQFTYTIGLFESYQHPELMIFGLGRDKSHAVLSECAAMIKSGTHFPLNERVPGVLSGTFDVFFRPLLKAHFSEYLGTAIRYYGRRNFEAYVLFWPDAHNHFIWESADQPSQARALSLVEKLAP